MHWGFFTLALMTILTVATWVPYSYVIYSSQVYPLDIAEDWIWRARASTDLAAMANYMEKALDQLATYHGNPCWFFPTPDTNYDYIKENIQECINSSFSFEGEMGSMAYQQLVHNLQETILELEDHLNLSEGWLYFTMPWTIYAIIELDLLWILPIIVGLKTD